MCTIPLKIWRENEKKYTSESIYDVVEDMALTLDDVVHKCWWQGKEIDCAKHLMPVFNEEGLCFTFNALNSHEVYRNECVLLIVYSEIIDFFI